MGFVLPLPEAEGLDGRMPTVVLDRLQDAGNVGSILRSASAFGFTQVAALKGTAALWSGKVLRAGMGAHFALRLVEGLAPADIDRLEVPLLATSSHEGDFLHRAALPWPCGWIMGHEGRAFRPPCSSVRGATSALRSLGVRSRSTWGPPRPSASMPALRRATRLAEAFTALAARPPAVGRIGGRAYSVPARQGTLMSRANSRQLIEWLASTPALRLR